MENWKGKEFDGFQIILKLEICAEKIVFNCSTLKKNRLLFVTFKKQSRRQRVLIRQKYTQIRKKNTNKNTQICAQIITEKYLRFENCYLCKCYNFLNFVLTIQLAFLTMAKICRFWGTVCPR